MLSVDSANTISRPGDVVNCRVDCICDKFFFDGSSFNYDSLTAKPVVLILCLINGVKTVLFIQKKCCYDLTH